MFFAAVLMLEAVCLVLMVFFFNVLWAWMKKTILHEQSGSVPTPRPESNSITLKNHTTNRHDVKVTYFLLNGKRKKNPPSSSRSKNRIGSLLGLNEDEDPDDSTSEGSTSTSNCSSCRYNEEHSEEGSDCVGCEHKTGRKPVMLLPPLLGQAGFGLYYLVANEFGDEYTYITWDLRNPSTSIAGKWMEDNARDGKQILQHLGYEKADVVCGFSLGVQVAVEFHRLYPDRVGRLIFLNGAYGNIFRSAFQPLGSIPFMEDGIRWVYGILKENIEILFSFIVWLSPFLVWITEKFAVGYSNLWLRRNKHWRGGTDFLKNFCNNFFGAMFTGRKKFIRYFTCYGELDAHNGYDALAKIKVPTLIISGLFDVVTPARLSFTMAKRIPNSRHYCSYRSSHASLLEDSAFTLSKMREFLAEVRQSTSRRPGSESRMRRKSEALRKREMKSPLEKLFLFITLFISS